jgi:CRISPR system Cascade subunit CasC
VLAYVGTGEVQAFADQIRERWAELADEKQREAAVKGVNKWALKHLTGHSSAPDIALFGRMMATEPRYGLEAACQVAHAISTHRLTTEPDYFTAVDDYDAREETGAGHVNYAEFNASTYYRYARVDASQLLKNLHDDADVAQATLRGAARAFVTAVPSGKQNASAAHNPPAFVASVVRTDGMGWNLAGAFETPVVPDGQGLVAASVAALDTFYGQLAMMYGTDTLRRVTVLSLSDAGLNNLLPYRVSTLDDWLSATLEAAL